MADDPIDQALAAVRQNAQRVTDASRQHEDGIVAAYEAGASINAIRAATVIPDDGVGQYTYEGIRQLLLRREVKLRPRGRPATR